MTITCKSRTKRINLGELDLEKVGNRIAFELKDISPDTPTTARFEFLREEGWETQAVKLRKYIGGTEIEFSTPKSLDPPTPPVGILELSESDLVGLPGITINVDTVEASSMISVEVELTYPSG